MSTSTKPIHVPDSGQAQRLRVSAGACSVQGARREKNEDTQYVSPDKHLFIVADGMGGHAAGELASKFAVDVLSHDLAQIAVDANEKEVEDRVRAALDRANCLILDTADENPKAHGAGTTVVFAVLLNHRLYVAGVGDSRAYLIRGDTIDRVTVDDTLPDTLLHLGHLSVDAARRHSMRNMLLTSLGLVRFEADKEEIRIIDVYHGDRYLLASDGLTDVVEDSRLLGIVNQNENPQRAAELLTQEAIANDAGDDITCIVFYVQSDLSNELSAASYPTFWQRLTSIFKLRR